MSQLTPNAVISYISDIAGDFIDIEKERGRLTSLIVKKVLDVMPASHYILKPYKKIENTLNANGEYLDVICAPCDNARILRTYDSHKRMTSYRVVGESIHVGPNTSHIYIDYYAIKTMLDEQGNEVPVIYDYMLDYLAYSMAAVLTFKQVLKNPNMMSVYNEFSKKASGYYDRMMNEINLPITQYENVKHVGINTDRGRYS